jgi:hypothetical protein
MPFMKYFMNQLYCRQANELNVGYPMAKHFFISSWFPYESPQDLKSNSTQQPSHLQVSTRSKVLTWKLKYVGLELVLSPPFH